jgi:cytidine deaminase
MSKESALMKAAQVAMKNAYCPYSKFPVGAALKVRNRAGKTKVFTGCNVENVSFGGTICAERVAMTKAVSEGYRELLEVAIVTRAPRPVAPCGFCRQVLAEFAKGQVPVEFAGRSGGAQVTTLSKILPQGMGRGDLG